MWWFKYSFSISKGTSCDCDNLFRDCDPQIAQIAITTNDAVLSVWSTVGRWEFNLSLKVDIGKKENQFIKANN